MQQQQQASPAMRVTQRAPQSCQRCASKKMRCSKQIPCTTCVKLGLEAQCSREVVVVTRESRNRRSSQLAFPRRRDEQRPEQTSSGVDAVGSQRADENAGDDASLAQDVGSVDQARPESILDEHGMIFGTVGPATNVEIFAFQQRYSARNPTLAQPGPLPASVDAPGPAKQGSAVDFVATSTDTKPENKSGIERANSRDMDNLTTLLKQTVLAPSWRTRQDQFKYAVMDIPGPISRRQALAVVRLHQERVAWSHNVIYSPLFERECQEYWSAPEQWEHRSWLALYNAVICIGLCHMSADEHHEIGIVQGQEIVTWFYERTQRALEDADYTAVHSVNSIQAICLMNLCAYHHFSDAGRMSVLFGTAIRIAQTLGLNRLGPDNPKPSFDTGALIDREIKKRIWSFLSMQDWFASGTISAVTTPMIYPYHNNTPLPSNCPERLADTIQWGKINNLSLDYPTQTSFQILMYSVARMMQQFHENTWSMKPLSREFLFEVLKADGKMNAFKENLPEFIRNDVPIKPDWPSAVRTQRKMFKITIAHKIIIVHQALLLQSFKDSMYTYTRQTCIRNALEILHEYPSGEDWEDESWAVPYQVAMAAAVFTCAQFESPDPSFSADSDPAPNIRPRRESISPKELLMRNRDKFLKRSMMRGGSMIFKCIDLMNQLLSLLEERGRSGLGEKGSVEDMPALIMERVGMAKSFSRPDSPGLPMAGRHNRRPPHQGSSDMIVGQWAPDLSRDIWGWQNVGNETMDIGSMTLDMGFF